MTRSSRAWAERCAAVGAAVGGAGTVGRPGDRRFLGYERMLGTAAVFTRPRWLAPIVVLVLACGPAVSLGEASSQIPASQVVQQSSRQRSDAGSAPGGSRARGVGRLAGAGDLRAQLLAPGDGEARLGGSTAVRALQRRLAALGFAPGPIDGRYGPLTERAVTRLQSADGLPVDGIAGPQTFAALSASLVAVFPAAGYQHSPARSQAGGHANDSAGLSTLVWVLLAVALALALLMALASRAMRGRAVDRRRLIAAPRPLTASDDGLGCGPDGLTASAGVASGTGAGVASGTGARVASGTGAGRDPGDSQRHEHGVMTSAAQRPERPAASGQIVADDAASAAPELAGVPAGSRLANDHGDAQAAFNLGVLLEGRGEIAAALAAYRRADEHNHGPAACNLGVLLEEQSDIAGALDAYHRAAGRGDANGAFNLGMLLEGRGEIAAALAAYRRADEHNHGPAACNLGVLLEEDGDTAGAMAAYRRAAERGDANGAFNLGSLLEEHGDRRGAAAAYDRARQQQASNPQASSPDDSYQLTSPEMEVTAIATRS